ncbi:hypothetical protein BOSE29B_81115 [Bosea sp. 29B]|nr:hypothetical protein BOSE29B_81115 [Bosea sp. 29B]
MAIGPGLEERRGRAGPPRPAERYASWLFPLLFCVDAGPLSGAPSLFGACGSSAGHSGLVPFGTKLAHFSVIVDRLGLLLPGVAANIPRRRDWCNGYSVTIGCRRCPHGGRAAKVCRRSHEFWYARFCRLRSHSKRHGIGKV